MSTIVAGSPQKTSRTVRSDTVRKTILPGSPQTTIRPLEETPTRLPQGSIARTSSINKPRTVVAKPIESGIFKLKSNLPGQTRKKPKLLTEMIFRPILDLRTAAQYWTSYAKKEKDKYDKLEGETSKENDNEFTTLKNAHRQLSISIVKRGIALITYEWAIVKRAIFNKKSISLEELNEAILELSNRLILNYSQVSREFKELLDNYEGLVTEYAGEEFTIDSDMRKLKGQISDLILVNDLGKKQVQRLLDIRAASAKADADIASDVAGELAEMEAVRAAAAAAEAANYNKTQAISAYNKIKCQRDGYSLDQIKELEQLDPIDRLIDICNTPDVGDNLNLEALRTLDINFKNRRAIHTSDMCLLASLKDILLMRFSNLSQQLIKFRNKINTDGSLGARGRYRNLDVDAFFRQPNLPFLSIASYCIFLTMNKEINGTRRGYFHMGELNELKISGPEAKEQLVTIYEFTKDLLVSNCGWNKNLLDNGITPPNSEQTLNNKNNNANIHMILCPMLSNIYNMIHLFRTSKKVEKNVTYKIPNVPVLYAPPPQQGPRFPAGRGPAATRAPVQPTFFQKYFGMSGGGSRKKSKVRKVMTRRR